MRKASAGRKTLWSWGYSFSRRGRERGDPAPGVVATSLGAVALSGAARHGVEAKQIILESVVVETHDEALGKVKVIENVGKPAACGRQIRRHRLRQRLRRDARKVSGPRGRQRQPDRRTGC